MGCEVNKAWFPYEWFDGVQKLDYPEFPEHKYRYVYSKLKGGKEFLPSDWENCKRIWKEKNVKTLKDWLKHYNDLDVTPGLEAITKMKTLYSAWGIGILKDAVSIPGVSMQFVLRGALNQGADRWSPSKTTHDILKDAVGGGPDLVFASYQEVGMTKI